LRRALALVIAAWPFDAGFESWRPDPLWPIPELPANWDDGLEYPD
jgi:hypothetical protein